MRAVERLAPRGYVDPSEPRNNVRSEKVVAEAGLLLLAASSVSQCPDVQTHVTRLARFLIPFARHDRMRLGVCLKPALALDYASAHIYLTRLGYRDAAFDALLRQTLTSRLWCGRERPPHRRLEQHWLIKLWGDSNGRSAVRTPSALLDSVLKWPIDLLAGARDDVYAFTHALLYVSEFETFSTQHLPRSRSAILGEAASALARSLDEEDYDLAGELCSRGL